MEQNGTLFLLLFSGCPESDMRKFDTLPQRRPKEKLSECVGPPCSHLVDTTIEVEIIEAVVVGV